MNLKLIKQDNLTNEIIAINPNVKKITLDYEIIKGEIKDYEIEKAKEKLGEKPFEELIDKLKGIDYIVDYEAEETRERTKEEKAEVMKRISAVIGKDNLNWLLNEIKKEAGYFYYERKIEIIKILGAIEVEKVFGWGRITKETAYIERIDFLLKNDDITIKYSVKPFCNLLDSEIMENLEKYFRIAQLNFLKDYAKKLCSSIPAEFIKPRWSILEKAVMKAKGETKF